MAKPLRSTDPTPTDVAFRHFGVLNDGERSKSATITSIVINASILAIILILGAVIKNNPEIRKKVEAIYVPPKPPPPETPKPKPPPPPPPKPLPEPPKPIQPPKIKLPEPEKLPEIKPVVVPVPKPVVLTPAPPKAVTPPPAPVSVHLATPTPASIPNHDLHSSPVKLGNPTNPLKSLTGAAASPVNLGSAGMPGMPKSNSGSGVAGATKVTMGSGAPGSQNMNGHDSGNRVVTGVKLGVPGGTGPLNSKNYTNAPVNVQMQVAPPPAAAKPQVQTATISSPPTVTYKPDPVYSAEAKAMHLEGNVSLKIRVTASGQVEVLGVVHGLGHGLDESATQATQNTRFKPAKDASGNPIDWIGVVTVRFQMS
jgi:TonB family protein